METEVSWNIEDLSNSLKVWWPSMAEIRDLGKFKFIITFETKEAMEEAYKQNEGTYG